jgi:hypothetical protein
MEEAQILSSKKGSALPSPIMDDDDDDFGEDEDLLDDDPDVRDLNNPDVESLAEPPLLGVRPKNADLGFGQQAEGFGRATSPKLYASAAQFPTAVQFRVWRWENGIPVGLGAIDAEATEEDFVRAFFDAMPRSGQGNFQFRMRPIDIRGQELGKEFTINISEHHATLRQMREAKKREEDDRMNGGSNFAPNWRGGGNPVTGGDIIVNNPATPDVGSSYAEEMGRMFEQAVETAEEQNKVLRESLEMERERLRDEEKTRAEERVSMAERSAATVEKMMERLMQSDRNRSDEAMKAQQQHSNFMMNTLTQVFAQQQEAARHQSERMRDQDNARMTQDREFFERQRQETESRRNREREEWESRRVQEREELERRRKTDNEDWERKRNEERERLQMEMRRWEETRKYEAEQFRIEAGRRETEAERRREQEREENRLRLERERLELEQRREQLRQEREQIRLEMEERRTREQQEFERKIAIEREERERRERADRERWERERAEAERKREDERREWERRETLRRDELTRDAQEGERKREAERQEHERREALRREELTREVERRREEMQMQMKQMEMQAEKDRQHAERMMEMARLERESQREAQQQREKMERDSRDSQDRDRQRQHELAMREMELSKERDREHAERMLQMSKMEKSGGLAGITDMLGMDTPEVLSKIFGGGGGGNNDDGSSWADTIPKVLAAVAEVAAKTLARPGPPIVMPQGGGNPNQEVRRPAGQPNMVAVQTPEGVKLIPADVAARMQIIPPNDRKKQPIPVALEEDDEDDFETDLPTEPMRPREKNGVVTMGTDWDAPKGEGPTAETEALRNKEPDVELVPPGLEDFQTAQNINPLRRAKEAGMKFSSQRAARRAIRELMPKLEKASSEEWIGVVTEALMKEPAIYEYLKVVSVYVALAEARVTPELAYKTVSEMKKSGMIPDDVPYTEADFAQLKGGGS